MALIISLDLVRDIDRAIATHVHNSVSIRPIIPVTATTNAVLIRSAIPVSEREYVKNLVCHRSIKRGYVLHFGDGS